MLQVLLDHGTTSYSVEGLHPCTDYQVNSSRPVWMLQPASASLLQAWLIGMVKSKESVPGPTALFSTECPPGLEANIKDLKEDAFTLVLDQEGKVELSCEDEEGRMFNRTEWGAEFVFTQLQVLFLFQTPHQSNPQPLTEYNCSGWVSPKRGLKLKVEPTLVTTLAERFDSFS